MRDATTEVIAAVSDATIRVDTVPASNVANRNVTVTTRVTTIAVAVVDPHSLEKGESA